MNRAHRVELDLIYASAFVNIGRQIGRIDVLCFASSDAINRQPRHNLRKRPVSTCAILTVEWHDPTR